MADRVCSCGPPIEKWFSILHRSYPAARSNKRGVEFIDAEKGGPGVRLRAPSAQK
jgi:hypothetical protein